ncbi:MAG: light-harvesting antenna LH1, beta subunit [Cyanobacteria bacterium J06598_3]
MADNGGSVSGLTENGAREYHKLFMGSTIGYVLVAVIAHFLVWGWRPWFPSTEGYTSAIETVSALATTLLG